MIHKNDCEICRNGLPMAHSKLLDWVEGKKDIFIAATEGLYEEQLYSFTCTIGLYRNFDHPEIVIFGLSPQMAHGILNTLKDDIKKGQQFELGIKYKDILERYDVMFKNIAFDKIFNLAEWYYEGKPFKTLWCVWPDTHNIFPWEDGFDRQFKNAQP